MPAVYAAVSVVLVIAVVAVAYGTQAPQLGVAEFAPAARQAVEPPPTTAGDASSPAAAGGRRSPRTTQPTTTTIAAATDSSGLASALTTRVARARSCVGNPPRQTEDPQSPPCITAIFEGDNGGATATGVSPTEVAVAVPMGSDDLTMKSIIEAQFEFLNQRYEFYGRRLKPVFVIGSASTPVQARQLAADLAARQIFAVLTSQVNVGSPHPALLSEAARQGIVTVTLDRGAMLADSVVYESLHPYVWSVFPSVEQRFRAATDLVCNSLAGKAARHAGAALKDTTRRFAIVALDTYTVPSTTGLEQGVSACAPLARTVKLTTSGMLAGTVRTALQGLKDDGVTTVLCLCGGGSFPNTFMGDAVAASFFPEWIPLYYYAAEEYFGNFISPGAGYDQLTNILLLSPNTKALPIQIRPSFNAVLATRPNLIQTQMATTLLYGDIIYNELALLAAGVQGAGPALTVDSFAQGLMGMQFPNPGAGQAPYWQQSVGFGPGDHSFFDDFVLAWWDRSAAVVNPNAPAGRGAWCYVNQGARYRAGAFPADVDSRFFDKSKPCR